MTDHKLGKYEAVVEQLSQTAQDIDEGSLKTIQELVSELDQREDFVYLVACLQVVADLALCKPGLEALEQLQVPDKLIDILNRDDTLVVPHVLKFFCRIYPTDLDVKYSRVLDKVFEYFQSDDANLLICSIDFLAVLARAGHSARKMLSQRNLFREKCLSRLGSILKCSDTSVKSRSLQCVIDLLEIHDDDPIEEAATLSENIYTSIIEGEGKMTAQVLALCRQPFMEVRVNALLLVTDIADSVWGQKQLAADPSFIPWLLNRSTEVCKEGKEAKFGILNAIIKSRTASKIFKPNDYLKMRSDFKNGPFHVGVAEEMQMAQETS